MYERCRNFKKAFHDFSFERSFTSLEQKTGKRAQSVKASVLTMLLPRQNIRSKSRIGMRNDCEGIINMNVRPYFNIFGDVLPNFPFVLNIAFERRWAASLGTVFRYNIQTF